MTSVAIVDYGLCNLDSITRAVEECGGKPFVTSDARDLAPADRIILPGVGSFGAAMRNLRAAGLDRALADAVLGERTPLLGICLGMQLLADEGTEGGDCAGLGILTGRVVRLDAGRSSDGRPARIPHIGWNDVHPVRPSPLFAGLDHGADFYFVHSYHLQARAEDRLATIDYCGTTTAAAGRDHIFAVQFHPEKSQAAGFRLLRNFLAY